MGLFDQFAWHRPERPRTTGQILWDTAFEPDDHHGLVLGTLEVPDFVIWVPVAAVGLWLAAYASGLFPYLGHYQHRSPDDIASSMPTGPTQMLLFEGQEAFIAYEIKSEAGYQGEVIIDIRPSAAYRPTEAVKRLKGTKSGTLKVTIPATGIYNFHHAAEPNSHREGLSYTVTWGAN